MHHSLARLFPCSRLQFDDLFQCVDAFFDAFGRFFCLFALWARLHGRAIVKLLLLDC